MLCMYVGLKFWVQRSACYGNSRVQGIFRSSIMRRCSQLGFKTPGLIFAASTGFCFGNSRVQGISRSSIMRRCLQGISRSSIMRRCSLLGFRTPSLTFAASIGSECGLYSGFWKRSLQLPFKNKFSKEERNLVPESMVQSQFCEGKSPEKRDRQNKLLSPNIQGDTVGTGSLLLSDGVRNVNLKDACSLPNKNMGNDCYDIVEIFSTMERDFLIHGNSDRVKVECLRGKIILIFFADSNKRCHSMFYNDIVEVYNELSPKGNFEVVFVALVNDSSSKDGFKNKESFDECFSKMPWLAIPFWDSKTRDRLGKLFYDPLISRSVIFNEKGEILVKSADSLFSSFGVDCYPFTKERVCELRKEHAAFRKEMSLTSLFSSSSVDFLISNKGTKVPISALEGKVVGLYMFYSWQSRFLMKKLLKIYKKVKEKGQNFEIVFVNVHFRNGYDDKTTFERNFKKMPWLALPFMHKCSRKLSLQFIVDEITCDYNMYENVLVIFGPSGERVECDAAGIINDYGIMAYPFTREKVAELRQEEAKRCTRVRKEQAKRRRSEKIAELRKRYKKEHVKVRKTKT